MTNEVVELQGLYALLMFYVGAGIICLFLFNYSLFVNRTKYRLFSGSELFWGSMFMCLASALWPLAILSFMLDDVFFNYPGSGPKHIRIRDNL